MANDWMDDAECRNHDPEEWFPVGNGEMRRKQSSYALYVCRNKCPVQAQCARHARRSRRRPTGIWAGVDLGDNASHAVSPAALAELDAVAGTEFVPDSTPVESSSARVDVAVGNRGRCVECDVATDGAAYGALGRCNRCYMRLRRERAAEAK